MFFTKLEQKLIALLFLLSCTIVSLMFAFITPEILTNEFLLTNRLWLSAAGFFTIGFLTGVVGIVSTYNKSERIIVKDN